MGRYKTNNKTVDLGDFPGGSVVKNLPANAKRYGFDPWSRRIPHATEQLNLRAKLLSLYSSCNY